MASKKFGLGILVMVLVFGMTVIGCDDGSNNNNNSTNGNSGLNTGNPSSTALNLGGITLAQFNQIKDAISGYQGWIIEDNDELVMVWNGRSLADETIITNFISNLGISDFMATYFSSDSEYLPYSIGDFEFSVGNLGVWFWND